MRKCLQIFILIIGTSLAPQSRAQQSICNEGLEALAKNEKELARYSDARFKNSYLRLEMEKEAEARAFGCGVFYDATPNKKSCLHKYAYIRTIEKQIDSAYDYIDELSELGGNDDIIQQEFADTDSYLRQWNLDLAEANHDYKLNVCPNIEGFEELTKMYDTIGAQCDAFAVEASRAHLQTITEIQLREQQRMIKQWVANCQGAAKKQQ